MAARDGDRIEALLPQIRVAIARAVAVMPTRADFIARHAGAAP